MQVWPAWWIKTAIDSETLFQDRRRAIQSFFWIKDFSFQFFLENCPPYCVTYGSMQTLGIRRSLEHTARWNTIFSHIYLHCITIYYAQQEISWKPGKTSKFGPIQSTIRIWTDFHESEEKNQNGRFFKMAVFQNRQFLYFFCENFTDWLLD